MSSCKCPTGTQPAWLVILQMDHPKSCSCMACFVHFTPELLPERVTHIAPYCCLGPQPPPRMLQCQTTASCPQTATCRASTVSMRTIHRRRAASRHQSWICRRCSMCWTPLMRGPRRLSSVPSKLKRLHRCAAMCLSCMHCLFTSCLSAAVTIFLSESCAFCLTDVSCLTCKPQKRLFLCWLLLWLEVPSLSVTHEFTALFVTVTQT